MDWNENDWDHCQWSKPLTRMTNSFDAILPKKVKHQLWPLDRKIRVIEQVVKNSTRNHIMLKKVADFRIVHIHKYRFCSIQAKLFVRRQEAEMEVGFKLYPKSVLRVVITVWYFLVIILIFPKTWLVSAIFQANCTLQAELKSDKTFWSYLQQGRLRAMQYAGLAFR